MLSVEEAKTLILSNQMPKSQETVSLENAFKRVLATEILSPCDMPLFNASAMDGYAFSHQAQKMEFTVIAESLAAGQLCKTPIQKHQAVRIMTGAALPADVDTVVAQELVERQDNQIRLIKPIVKGENVRECGEEIREGAVVLTPSTVLNANHLSYLAGLGISELKVSANPKVCIIPTGSELVNPSEPRLPGQIYESTSIGLKLAMQELGIAAEVTPIIPDDPAALTQILLDKLKTSTHILLCGGVSVGDFDFNKSVLADCGVATVFWKVAQKPGKPFYFGRKGDSQVFGMPGNPVSSMICYYEYVRAALCKYQGRLDTECSLKTATAKLKTPITKKLGITHFIRAWLEYENITLMASTLTKQGSHMMSGLSVANGLIVAPAEVDQLATNQEVTVHWLP